MTIQTLILKDGQWQRFNFEIALVPGLPLTHFLNAPDSSFKEIAIRLRTAFRKSGLKWPRTQSIIINFENLEGWKTEGLDLAIAVGVLASTGQLPKQDVNNFVYYGSVGLNGEVFSDLNQSIVSNLIVGQSSHPVGKYVKNLNSLVDGQFKKSLMPDVAPQRVALQNLEFSKPCANLMALVAHGEHSLLLAGRTGIGKTTFIESLSQVLPLPTEQIWKQIRHIGFLFDEQRTSRPFRAPHHTASVKAILGGGRPITYGEITRAHGGILLFDEFLEFPTAVQEGLREPLEEGSILISRAGVSRKIKSRFLFCATTNLCPCGKLEPLLRPRCSQALTKCRSVIKRLSGPILDRIEILSFTSHFNGPRMVSLQEIRSRVDQARAFALSSRRQIVPNSFLNLSELKSLIDPKVQLLMECRQMPPRLERTLLRVARSFADLREVSKIEREDLFQAEVLVEKPRHQLSQMFA